MLATGLIRENTQTRQSLTVTRVIDPIQRAIARQVLLTIAFREYCDARDLPAVLRHFRLLTNRGVNVFVALWVRFVEMFEE